MDKITIICEGGWKYTGQIISQKLSISGNLEWIRIDTGSSEIDINSKYIVSILKWKK